MASVFSFKKEAKMEEATLLRPTPILKGRIAERFYKEFNNRELSEEQEAFIQDCASVFDDLTQEEGKD